GSLILDGDLLKDKLKLPVIDNLFGKELLDKFQDDIKDKYGVDTKDLKILKTSEDKRFYYVSVDAGDGEKCKFKIRKDVDVPKMVGRKCRKDDDDDDGY
uniref:RANASPUMIN-2 n=1 Tax=Engystomops pustulosus TaxID=76066 RepID=UPI0001A7C52C|nr:Chain A, RANASPUMIN-2 [Engystomops pustulosus]